MHKLMVALTAGTMLAASSVAALAAEASGAISSIDPTAGTVTLDSGETFVLPAGFDAASLQVGDQVTITYDEGAGGEMQASDVAPSS
jgi:ABC-type sugar transport system substrate-binding protein